MTTHIQSQETNMNIRDFDPSLGMAFQGDVSIVPVPSSIHLSKADEINPVNGSLILQEGEVTGHHHAIAVMERSVTRKSKAADDLMQDALAGKIALPSARLYRDSAAAQAMVSVGVLTRPDLVVGFLVIETGPMVVTHQEHDGIRLPIGTYCIGRQVESAGAEERRVAD